MTDSNGDNYERQKEFGIYGILAALFVISWYTTVNNWTFVPWLARIGMASPALAAVLGGLLFQRCDKQYTKLVDAARSIFLTVAGISLVGLGLYGMAPQSPFSSLAIARELQNASLLCLTPGLLTTSLGLFLYYFDILRPEIEVEEGGVNFSQRKAKMEIYQQLYEQAKTYQKRIQNLPRENKQVKRNPHFRTVRQESKTWRQRAQKLADRLIKFQQNKVIHRALVENPKRIASLQQRLAAETNPRLKHEIKETLLRRRKKQQQLERLSELMHRAELDLEEMVTAMGTIYAQFRVLDAIDIKSNRMRRLSHEIEEQIAQLDDLVQATDELYGQ